jgi:hypothetical protein
MPTDPEPLVRARFCKEWLEQVALQPEPYRSKFFAGLEPSLREQIESSSRVGWLPVAIYVHLADVLQREFGGVQAHAYYRRAFAASLSSPFFAPVVQMGARLLGMTPAMFVRWASKGWDASFRNAGQLVGEVLGPGRAQLLYKELPHVFTDSDAWMLSCQASTYGALDFLGVQGVVRVGPNERTAGRMRLDLEWTERGQ